MLSRPEILDLAHEHGVGAHGDRLLRNIRPGWRLDPVDRSPALGASKIGGHPDLAPHESWPLNARGIPMTFLAQVDTANLAAVGEWQERLGWRTDGQLLRVFADLLDCPFEPGLAVALAVDPTAELSRIHAPAMPNPYPPGGPSEGLDSEERFHVLPEAAVDPEPFLTAPEVDAELKPEMFGSSELSDAYDDWARDLRSRGAPDESLDIWEGEHHLLGEAVSVQDDVRQIGAMVYSGGWGAPETPALGAEDAWRVLLSLHSDERIGLDILDAGAFTVLIPAVDLAKGRYDRLVCSVDSC